MNIYSMKMKWMKIEYSKHVWKIENERRRRTNRRHNPQGLCFYCDCWCVKKIQALVRLVPFRTRKGTSWKREVRKNEQDVPGNVPSNIPGKLPDLSRISLRLSLAIPTMTDTNR